MTEGPIRTCLSRYYRLARRHEGTKKIMFFLPFVPSCLRAQKPSVFRFIERAA